VATKEEVQEAFISQYRDVAEACTSFEAVAKESGENFVNVRIPIEVTAPAKKRAVRSTKAGDK